MNPFHQDVPALVILLVPAAGILQENVPDDYSLTFVEMDIFRTLGLLKTVISKGILKHSEVDKVDEPRGDLEASAINRTTTLDTDVLLAYRENQGRPFGIGILDVVERIERAQKSGILVYPKRHIILKIDCPGDIVSLVQDNTAAAMRGDEVYRGLYAYRVEGKSVRNGPEIPREVICGKKPLASAGK